MRDQVAVELGISPLTVKDHLQRAIIKLGACNKTHAVVLAIGRGFIAL